MELKESLKGNVTIIIFFSWVLVVFSLLLFTSYFFFIIIFFFSLELFSSKPFGFNSKCRRSLITLSVPYEHLPAEEINLENNVGRMDVPRDLLAY